MLTLEHRLGVAEHYYCKHILQGLDVGVSWERMRSAMIFNWNEYNKKDS